jgi:hypothetical protein
MILASINGTHGLGYVETIERTDGSVHRVGVLRLSASKALRLQTLVDNRKPLTYSGPVLANGRWCVDTIPIVVTSIHPEPGAPAVVCVILHEAMVNTAAA